MEQHSAIREQVRQELRRLKGVRLLVGIPCYNCESTIARIVETAAAGLCTYFPSMRPLIFVSDGGSLDDSREESERAEVPAKVKKTVAIYRGKPGKGTALKAIFEAAQLLDAKACCVLDADLRSMTPDWVKRLLSPIIEDDYQFVAPLYDRHKHDGTITNNIVYPVNRALYGLKIRQPIGGDFGFSGELAKFYAQQPVWDSHIAEFGVDVWMTTTAINGGYRICQSNLGVKLHAPKDPAASLGPMFMQVIWTLFTLMGQFEGKWRRVKGSRTVKTYNGSADHVPPEPVEVSMDKLRLELKDGFDHFGVLYREILSKDSFPQLENVIATGSRFSPKLWARVLYDFSVVFNKWERNRRKLVDVLTPLYFGRTVSLVEEIREMTNREAEGVIEAQATVFEKEKPYLMRRWKE